MPLPFRNLKSAALWVKLRTLGRRSTMLSFIRGGFAVALLAFAPLAAGAAEKPFQDQRLAAHAAQAARPNPPRRRCGVYEKRFPRRHGAAWPNRRFCTERRRHLAPLGADG